jgi:polyferredoxin
MGYIAASPTRAWLDRRLDATGRWLAANQLAIRRVQWATVAAYLVLLSVPAVLPLPGRAAFIWNDFTRFAQFVFWGLWWPGVILVTALFGRVWCGLLCPEGFLSETASFYGLGRSLPRWLRWGGWPTAAFSATTLYGQLTSVYQYPGPAMLVLGGSTLAAIATGYLYGRNKRVWCRYLCPAGGVFGLLAKLAPFQFEVDQAAWKRSQERRDKPSAVNCAPM